MKFLAKSLLLSGLLVVGKLVKQQSPEAVITIAPDSLSLEATSTQPISFFTRQLYPQVVSVQENQQPWRITPAYFTTNEVVNQ
ncbi:MULTISPECIES: hypothetical protein [Hymenobacter]|uniref:Uncharacterized protein n=2 Tax=Hymenobacter TaxID=89966 RepID=A0ABS6X1S3_9BACT|nr:MULTISPECIES: hypothetical protein [Hymenobacter]MBO3270348.1 hypothetical protein [Hymenobacter defluvii]MBW3129785.1 hypothetical protein [Hymenobacter profundi]QNE41653.1 hypothetical protein F1C16_19820 [Hymenobacter sp. NBH84]